MSNKFLNYDIGGGGLTTVQINNLITTQIDNNKTSSNTPNTLVFRNSSGAFSIGDISCNRLVITPSGLIVLGSNAIRLREATDTNHIIEYTNDNNVDGVRIKGAEGGTLDAGLNSVFRWNNSGFITFGTISGANLNISRNVNFTWRNANRAWWMLTNSGYDLSGASANRGWNVSGHYLRTVLDTPTAPLQDYNIMAAQDDSQWYTPNQSNRIYEQLKDYSTFWLKNAPNGTFFDFFALQLGSGNGCRFTSLKINNDTHLITGYNGNIRNFSGFSGITALAQYN